MLKLLLLKQDSTACYKHAELPNLCVAILIFCYIHGNLLVPVKTYYATFILYHVQLDNLVSNRTIVEVRNIILHQMLISHCKQHSP